MRVEAVNPRTRRFDEVIELHRRYRKTLGFLPAGAFAEYAGDGTLLGALADDGLLVGYALYDLPRSEIALRHLCVDAKVRGMGVARALVEELANRHSDRAGIRVRCRRDWDANTMWPRLDFEPLDDRPGRSSEGRLLTTWWRDFGQPNLLSGIPEPGGTAYLAALDTDVFIDLELSRDGGEESRNLLTDWVLELVELVITKEVVQEINNQNDPDVRRKQRGRAVGFRRIDTSDALVKAATQRLLAGLPGPPRTPHDQADVRHVARAHAGGASYFLTRDEQLIRRLGPAAEARLGVQVLTPAMFLRTLWALDQPLAYSPAALANTTFEITAVTAEVEADACKVFVNYREGERLVEFRRKLRALIGSPSVWEVLLVRDASTSPRGLIVRGVAKNVLRVPMIRVAGGSGLTMARHLLHLQRSHATELGLRVVSVDADDVSNEVAAALRDEDFAPGADRWSAATVRAVGTAVDVAPVLNKTRGPDELRFRDVGKLLASGEFDRELLAQIESRYWPLKVCEPELPTFLVPVRAAFAEQLFDTGLSEQTLFARDDSLGLSREHVYYRSPVPRIVSAPARVIWYVSREARVRGTGAVRACSALNEVVVERPRSLHRRFRRLGVYRQRDVEGAAKGGRAMALRFTNTELFANPIALSELRAIALNCGHTLNVRSAWKLPEHMFEEVYRRGIAQ